MGLPHYLRLLAVGAVLVRIESFDLFDGFGITNDAYDPFDLEANVIGVGIAISTDTAISNPRPGNPEGRVEH